MSSPAGFAWSATQGEWQLEPYLALLDEHLVAVAERQIRRLAVFMPPRHGKSELISRFFSAWYVMRYQRRVLLSSYEARFAQWWGLQARELVREFGSAFGVSLSRVLAQQSWWGLEGVESRASMATAGVGGPVTGKGGDILICDDPVKNAAEADSETIREAVWRWWTRTWVTRKQPGAGQILVMTRWNLDDVGGRVLDATGQDWTVLKLPAIADEREVWQVLWPSPKPEQPPQQVEWVREEGEALCPSRFPLSELAEIRSDLSDERAWSALYQQQPVPEGGAIWHREWFTEHRYSWTETQKAWTSGGLRAVKRYLNLVAIIGTVDAAEKKGVRNDWSVIATWGKTRDGRYRLLDIWREKVEFPELLDAAYAGFMRWRWNALHIEDASNGTPLIQSLQKRKLEPEEMQRLKRLFGEVPRVPVMVYEPMTDKIARAKGVTPLPRNGLVDIPSDECPFIEEWLREHALFPLAKNDDEVDTSGMALEVLRDLSASAVYAF